jgi:hypothetical protein
MKKLAMFFSVVAAFCAVWNVYAQDVDARIDVSSDNNPFTIIDSKAGDCKLANFNGDENLFYFMFTASASADEWTKGEFTFKAAKDGKVLISLMGPWKPDGEKPMRIWCMYDDVAVAGAELKNGDFESSADPWILIGAGDEKAKLVKDQKVAHGGNSCIQVWHNGCAQKYVKVKADTPVTVSFWFKAVK